MTLTKNAVKLYKLKGHPQEYELIDTYVGWKPAWCADWDDSLYRKEAPSEVLVMNTKTNESVKLLLHEEVKKNTFPENITNENRFKKWQRFYIVSLKNNPTEKFIIPLH